MGQWVPNPGMMDWQLDAKVLEPLEKAMLQ